MSVFANTREVSGKAQPNKIIAGFPSVCLSPPSPPAGPIPIPYPMFTDASKTSKGSRTVKVKKKEAGKKNASLYKSSKGNEPATRSFGMDVVSHTLSGATKHLAWSFDVKIEGKNAIRFLDLTTTNHNNPATAFTIDTASLHVEFSLDHDNPCKVLNELNEQTRNGWSNTAKPQYVAKTANGNTTITSSFYMPPAGEGPHEFRQASSRQVMQQYDNSLAQGLSSDERAKKRSKTNPKSVESDVCNGHTYKRGFWMPHSSHTEARLLEDIFRGREKGTDPHMGTLILSIDWPGGTKKGLSNKSPCPECQALICAAVECIDIKICDDSPNPPVDQSEVCP